MLPTEQPAQATLDPAIDRRLVALGSPTLGALDRPTQPVVQQGLFHDGELGI
jgi:hypothetical protein